jgi:hypothetical protein
VFTTTLHDSLTSARWIHSIRHHHISLRSILILSSHLSLRLSSGLLSYSGPTETLNIQSSSAQFVLHALPISSSWTWSFQLYLAKTTSYEAPHYAVFSNLLSLNSSSVHIIFSRAPSSQTPSVCLRSQTTFTTYTEPPAKFSKHYPNSIFSFVQ